MKMSIYASAFATVIAVAFPAYADDVKIDKLHFDIFTGKDDKDRGDELKYYILLDNTIIEENGPASGDLVFRDDSSNTWDIQLRRPFMKNECSRMSFIVEKIGSDRGWYAAFKLTGNGNIILYDTPRDSNNNYEFTLFGKRNPIEVDMRDAQIATPRFRHFAGPNWLEYKFNRCS